MASVVDLTGSSPDRRNQWINSELHVLLNDAISIATRERLQIFLKILVDAPEIGKEACKLFLGPVKDAHPRGRTPPQDSDKRGSDEEGKEEDEDEDEDEDEEEEGCPTAEEGQAVIFPQNTLTNGTKRLRPRFVICEQCDEEFDATANYKGDCVWHDGDKEPDYDNDFWADHDEDCHGVIADLGDEYPEGFVWTCCDKDGTAEGCHKTAHKEVVSSWKRARY